MKICFVSKADPNDRRSFSGTLYNLLIKLKENHEVDWIGAIPLKKWEQYYLKATRVFNKLRGYNTSGHTKFFSERYGKRISKKLKKSNYDLIFAPAASECIAYLNTNIPIIYLSDATFQSLVNYYPFLTGLRKKNLKEGNEIEYNAINKARKLIYSSQWAAASAIQDYSADQRKLTVIDFGPNLLKIPNVDEIKTPLKNTEICNVLFIGVDWMRKGGNKVYNTFRLLNEAGFRCKLTIIGCNPELSDPNENVCIIPFLDKNNEADFKELYKHLLNTHFLFLPAVADCTPIVFSEAAAFGIPVLTTNTGGIPSVIIDGVNGFLFPVDADEKQYADKIMQVFRNQAFYTTFRDSCRNEFETRLNWDIWNTKFNALLSDIK